MKYAYETLRIEKHRLLQAIRNFRSLRVAGDDAPVERIKEHMESVNDLDEAIAFLDFAKEEMRRLQQSDNDKYWQAHEKIRASRSFQ